MLWLIQLKNFYCSFSWQYFRVYFFSFIIMLALISCNDKKNNPSSTNDVEIVLADAPSEKTADTEAIIGITATGMATYQYQLDNTAITAKISLENSLKIRGLSIGNHTLKIFVYDSSGSMRAQKEIKWSVVIGPKLISLVNIPKIVTTATKFNIPIADKNFVAYKYRLNNGSWSNEISTSNTMNFENLPAGSNSIDVLVKDMNGIWTNVFSPAKFIIIVLEIKPAAEIKGAPYNPTVSKDINSMIKGIGVVSYKYKLDNETWSNEANINTPIKRSALNLGDHTLKVIGKNFVGTWQNIAEATTHSWKIVFDSYADYSNRLKNGEAFKGSLTHECPESVVLDNIEALCEIFMGGPCMANNSSCNSYERQLFMGTRLGSTPQFLTPPTWNGMGGSGALVTDSILCSLRELSPNISGAAKNSVDFSLGIGDLSVTQEVGFLDFDREDSVFKGYRKVKVKLPVLGEFVAVAQDLSLSKNKYTYVRNNPYEAPLAGRYEIKDLFGITVKTQDKRKSVSIKPKGFPVVTPIGTFTASPIFEYGQNSPVVDSPYQSGNNYYDVVNFLNSGNSVRYFDIFGVNAGATATDKDVQYHNFVEMRTGWSSQLAMGTRGRFPNTTSWSPSGNPLIRNDLNLEVPRSTTEALPSLYVSAAAKIEYPDNPADILPDWVMSLPFMSTLIAKVSVAPTISAGISSEFSILNSEGSNHDLSGEFKFASERFHGFNMKSNIRADGKFEIIAGITIQVILKFPWPIGKKTIVNLNESFPIPLYNEGQSGVAKESYGFSEDRNYPEQIYNVKSFNSATLKNNDQTQNFITACYAKENVVPAYTPPKEDPVPGNPQDLFANADIEWPCNICLYAGGESIPPQWVYPGGEGTDYKEWFNGIEIPAKGEFIFPSTTPNPATWNCNSAAKSGCMELCKFDPIKKTLVVSKTLNDIAQEILDNYPNDIKARDTARKFIRCGQY
ncbi:MAG: hypothetical protein HQK51_16580 [Oligoflexia bacterium]|nr:hypothetical protein [Oligoflexia bacterium]